MFFIFFENIILFNTYRYFYFFAMDSTIILAGKNIGDTFLDIFNNDKEYCGYILNNTKLSDPSLLQFQEYLKKKSEPAEDIKLPCDDDIILHGKYVNKTFLEVFLADKVYCNQILCRGKFSDISLFRFKFYLKQKQRK